MPDITMCYGVGCPAKYVCYRYTAIPSKRRQAYFCEVPYNAEEKYCYYFWGQGAVWPCQKEEEV